MPILVDTSVLVRLRDQDSPHRQDCIALLASFEKDARGAVLCAQVLIEYWVVATRPAEVNGLGLAPTEADADLSRFVKLLPCLPEPPHVLERWRRLVVTSSTRGRPAHDARLVAFMDHHGIRELVTLNPSDFGRFNWITCRAPGEVARALNQRTGA